MSFIYSTILTNIAHIPHFIPLLAISFLLLTFFFLPSLLFIRQKIIPTKIYLTTSVYISTALFIVLVDILSRLGITYWSAIATVSVFFVILGSIGLYKNYFYIFKLKKYIINNKQYVLSITFLSISICFLMSKFIYLNGLHDEWQHYAVVESMESTNKFPIKDEFNYSLYISDYYHYGWYYLVLFVKQIFFLPTEVGLDVLKLFLILPVLSLFDTLLRSFFNRLNWFPSVYLSLVAIFQGPSLFLLDAYSGNILLGKVSTIIYQPLFFQLAGITWYGVIYALVFSVLFFYILNHKFVFSIVFLIFSFYAMFILNKAFMLTTLFAIAVTTFFWGFKKIKVKSINTKKILLFLSSFLLLIFLLLIFFKHSSPLLLGLVFKGGSLFIRPEASWGFPYGLDSDVRFLSLLSYEFLSSFGLVPIISMLITLFMFVRKRIENGFLFILLLQLSSFFLSYFLHFAGSELALNKYFVVFMTASLIVTVAAYQSRNTILRVLVLLFASLSILSPLIYFSSLQPVDQQRYWNDSDQIIEYLKKEKQFIKPTVLVDDIEYAKVMINTLDVQLLWKIESQMNPDIPFNYVVTESKENIYEPVAQSDTHTLYKVK